MQINVDNLPFIQYEDIMYILNISRTFTEEDYNIVITLLNKQKLQLLERVAKLEANEPVHIGCPEYIPVNKQRRIKNITIDAPNSTGLDIEYED